ncbi:MAG: ferredoxin:protochlorophyllide reductase (ATP-dependent) subunit B [Chromatiaceae bacterium]|jgi:light-independent protochlorophyllide reductase subunit B
MELTFWTYEGPPHVGAIRVVTSMRDVHLVLHAPQGDTYADLLFTMIERRDKRPPVTYTTFQARDLGQDTAALVIRTLRDASERFKPKLMLVADSCTAELLQDQPGSLARGANLPVPIIPLELAAYSRKENWGASEAFYHLVRGLLAGRVTQSGSERANRPDGRQPSVNLLGPSALGFRCRDDVTEISRLLERVGVRVNVTAPLNATPEDLLRIPDADANVCLYPEVAKTTCSWLQRAFRQPTISTVPIGVGATLHFLREVGELLDIDVSEALDDAQSRLPWYSRSVDSTYLTGKRVFIFADATHAIAAARIARDELGFDVVGLGTYARELARDVRTLAAEFGLEALITDDYLEVEKHIAEAHPELVLGTQMERHIAKRLGIGCAVISTPAHVQDYPARYSPQMGFEGANVIFDSWVHPLMMGLEEHLLTMFREDFEFNDHAAPSHLASVEGHAPRAAANDLEPTSAPETGVTWDSAAEKELKKIPFFVRGKARRNTERFAIERGVDSISLETLYEAKAHFGR